jgi:hypothetical protein
MYCQKGRLPTSNHSLEAVRQSSLSPVITRFSARPFFLPASTTHTARERGVMLDVIAHLSAAGCTPQLKSSLATAVVCLPGQVPKLVLVVACGQAPCTRRQVADVTHHLGGQAHHFPELPQRVAGGQ